MNTLHKYLTSIGKDTEIENLPANDLDHLLSKFFMEVKKQMAASEKHLTRFSLSETSVCNYSVTLVFRNFVYIFLMVLNIFDFRQ